MTRTAPNAINLAVSTALLLTPLLVLPAISTVQPSVNVQPAMPVQGQSSAMLVLPAMRSIAILALQDVEMDLSEEVKHVMTTIRLMEMDALPNAW